MFLETSRTRTMSSQAFVVVHAHCRSRPGVGTVEVVGVLVIVVVGVVVIVDVVVVGVVVAVVVGVVTIQSINCPNDSLASIDIAISGILKPKLLFEQFLSRLPSITVELIHYKAICLTVRIHKLGGIMPE